MTYKCKLNATFTLDEKLEVDIINTVENLKSKHKLGEYTSALYRVAANNPDVARLVKAELGGSLNSRDTFFNSIQTEMSNCRADIDLINSELVKIKSALLYGNRIGLTGKTDNLAISITSVERHLNKLKKSLNGNLGLRSDSDKGVNDLNEIALEVFDMLDEMIPVDQYVKDMQQAGFISNSQVQAIQDPNLVNPVNNTIVSSVSSVASSNNTYNSNNDSISINNISNIEREEVVGGDGDNAPDLGGLFAFIGED